jgi:hypothetical protein
VLHLPRQPQQADEGLRVADLAGLRHRDGHPPRDRAEPQVLVFIGPATVGIGGHEVRCEVQMHQLCREAGRRPERGDMTPGAGTHARLFLELPRRSDGRILERARDLIHVQRPGWDLQQDAARGVPPLVH